MIPQEVMEQLICFTKEEMDNRNGENNIDKTIFENERSNVVDYHKILMNDQQLSVRKHTRFCEYPKHRHNYIELMYVYSGEMTHFIDHNEITIHQGELLLLNQNIEHAIGYTGENDIIFNFIMRPEFLNFLSGMMEKENEVSSFIFDALYSYENRGEYMVFQVSDNEMVKNYVELIITNLYQPKLNNQLELKLLVGLLLTELMNHPESMETYSKDTYDKMLVTSILKYIFTNYRDGSLQELSKQLKLPDYKICKLMKKEVGKTYKDMIMDARLQQASILLKTTDMIIDSIIDEVGYDNVSYFYRIFHDKYHMTPKQYREQYQKQPSI